MQPIDEFILDSDILTFNMTTYLMAATLFGVMNTGTSFHGSHALLGYVFMVAIFGSIHIHR